MDRLREACGLDPNAPHMALQFPRLPPGLTHPMFRVYGNPAREQMARDSAAIGQKLDGFQRMYQEHAAGLLTMNNAAVPPGHPLYHRANSVEALRAENKKLLKENSELRKMLEDVQRRRSGNGHPDGGDGRQ